MKTEDALRAAIDKLGAALDEVRLALDKLGARRQAERGIVGDGSEACLAELEAATDVDAWRRKWSATTLTVYCDGVLVGTVTLGREVRTTLPTGQVARIRAEEVW